MSFKKRFLRMMVITAFMAALSIVLGKYLAINIGETLRFSFENLPILFCGMALGPIAGLSCGILADLVGCVLVGYAINPIITVGAAAIGAISGIYRLLPKKSRSGDILLFCLILALAHVTGSVIIKTYGLAVYYDMPLYALMLWRLLNYAIVAPLEWALIYTLLKNQPLRRRLEALGG
jgi:ECF transporter S component (folate family)